MGRPRRAWFNDIKEWTNLSTVELLQSAKDRAAWRSVVFDDANVRTDDEDDGTADLRKYAS